MRLGKDPNPPPHTHAGMFGFGGMMPAGALPSVEVVDDLDLSNVVQAASLRARPQKLLETTAPQQTHYWRHFFCDVSIRTHTHVTNLHNISSSNSYVHTRRICLIYLLYIHWQNSFFCDVSISLQPFNKLPSIRNLFFVKCGVYSCARPAATA